MSRKKVVKLVDNRGCTGVATREIRSALRGIDSGDVVGVGIVTIHRDGSLRTYSQFDCPIRGLGACEMLRTHIVTRNFKRD